LNNSFKLLERNKFFYDYFVENKIIKVKNKLTDQELMKRIGLVAKFSWRNHAGYFFDGKIENILYDYGNNLEKCIDIDRMQHIVRRSFSDIEDYTILHLATNLYEVGGHTRMLYQFIKRYDKGNQLLVLTGQGKQNIPNWFISGISSDIKIVRLDSFDSFFDRAYILRYISNLCKHVISYHHPYDIIPILSFSINKCPPVIIENHAHSWFWLGPSIADLVFTHSLYHKDFTLKTRPVEKVHYLPSTDIDDPDVAFDIKDKYSFKEKLNISRGTLCIITVGTPDKFVPNSHYDFFKTAEKIVHRFKNVEIFIIGISTIPRESKYYKLDKEKIHLVGPVSDPGDYYKAADIYLESLPQPSTGATINSTPTGLCCPLLKYGSGDAFNMNNAIQSELYKKFIGSILDEEDYLNKIDFLINNPEVRWSLAKEIKDNYLKNYSNQIMTKAIKEMLSLMENKIHSPKKIPNGTYYSDAVSAEIAETSFLQDIRGVFEYFQEYIFGINKIKFLIILMTKKTFIKDVLFFIYGSLYNKLRKLIFIF
jgi:hypothetical protein